MNKTNDSEENALKPAAAKRNPKRNPKRALAAASEYVSRVLAASALTMWGAFNLVVSIKNASGEAVEGDTSGPWWITLAFVAVTSLLPFLCGLHLFRKLYQRTKVQ